ncbi:relaxase/mobilization nuclease domain-containing protein [Helicobacter bilis]|uniref:relaxase/mobilization nuclease domain-containing protein n=1 Tax=Helicobacter bilis TaxID=37372 RepID=UPI0029425A69|nr:relaxase [Helicobacter bilis]
MPRQPYKHVEKVLADFFSDEELRIQKRFYKEPPKKIAKPANLSLLKKDKRFSKQSVVKLLSNLTAKGAYNAINYIIRHSLYDYAIDENGMRVSASEVLKDWQKDFSSKPNSKEAWHLCFSMREEVNAENIYALQQSVNDLLQKHFHEYKYVKVLHIHQNNPHIHVVINKNSMLTHKKLHFKDKDSIKNFFNEMRDDFADSLNYHGDLNYHNAYKFEKTNILEKIDRTKQKENRHSYMDTISQLSKDKDIIANRKEMLQQKINNAQSDIKEYTAKKQDYIQQLKIITAYEKNYSKYQKLDYKTKQQYKSLLNSIKELNIELKSAYKNQKIYKQEIYELNRAINNLGFDFMKHRNQFAKDINDDYSNVLAKKAYLDFVMKHKKYATREQLHIVNDIQNEIRKNTLDITQSIALQNELDNALLQHLGVKSTSKSLIFTQKDITKKLQVLHSIDKNSMIDTKLLDDYKNTLQTNNIVIDKIINDKILHYESIFNDEAKLNKHHIKTLQYYFKEFQNLTSYLDSKADDKIHYKEQQLSDFTLLQTKINSFFTEHENEVKQQEKDLEQQQYYTDFIEWYIIDRKMRNIDYMRKSLHDKYKNNTLHEYLEKYDNTALVDYKVHLRLLEKEKQKQNANTQENALNKKGLER